MIKFLRGASRLKLKHGDHGKGTETADDDFHCHVRGIDEVRTDMKGSSVVSVSLCGLRVSRLNKFQKS